MTGRAVLMPILIAAAFAVAIALRAGAIGPARPEAAPDPLRITAVERARGIAFLPTVPPEMQREVRAALRRTRPEARRLIAEVDGQVTVGIHDGLGDAVGLAEPMGEGISITFDAAQLDGLDPYLRRHVIVHELGHAVDFTLLDDAAIETLNAGVPTSDLCLGGAGTGDCADPHERVADTFAKWAMNSPGYTMDVGYHIAAPADLDAWGAPLAAVARDLPAG